MEKVFIIEKNKLFLIEDYPSKNTIFVYSK